MTLAQIRDRFARMNHRLAEAAPILTGLSAAIEASQTAMNMVPTLYETCLAQDQAIVALQAEILELRKQLGIVPPPDSVDPGVLDVLSFEGFQAKTAKSEAMSIPVTP